MQSNPPDSDTASTATGAGSVTVGDERQAFIDAAAIARFGAGYPVTGCYREAEHLWRAREEYIRAEQRRVRP